MKFKNTIILFAVFLVLLAAVLLFESKGLKNQEKKEKEARKRQRMSQVKEIRLKPKIGEHDYITKLNFIEKFVHR